MSKVYFVKDISKLSSHSEKLLKDVFPDGSKVIIKIHFGEPGNKSAFVPEDIKPVVDVLKKKDIEVVLLDTPVAYNSPRSTVEGYEKVAKDRGYEELGDVVISGRYKDVKTKDFVAPVSRDLINSGNVLVISHVKGHSCAGFGGAIKNLGMGGLSPEGKSKVHNLCKPKFVKECEGCGMCADLCPAKAIEMVDGKAKINLEKCWGCSICQINCPHNCLAPEKAYFDDLLAQGACAVINSFKGSVYYINFLLRISKDCDCESEAGGNIAKDVGILFSDNPVAIDKASVDLINKNEGRDVFQETHHKDPMLQIDYASKYCKFGKEYEVVEL